ncbi:MAG: hypothetical protein AAE986_06995 [Thermoplasmataceae archaeon]|nr:hypothetical protein [Candidatus Thermoplasmatota archaeon]
MFKKFRNRRVMIPLVVLVVLLLVVCVPVVPLTAPGGAIDSSVRIYASISYALTSHGFTYWGGQLWWGRPPVA